LEYRVKQASKKIRQEDKRAKRWSETSLIVDAAKESYGALL
jgi:hypothetical protein